MFTHILAHIHRQSSHLWACRCLCLTRISYHVCVSFRRCVVLSVVVGITSGGDRNRVGASKRHVFILMNSPPLQINVCQQRQLGSAIVQHRSKTAASASASSSSAFIRPNDDDDDGYLWDLTGGGLWLLRDLFEIDWCQHTKRINVKNVLLIVDIWSTKPFCWVICVFGCYEDVEIKMEFRG